MLNHGKYKDMKEIYQIIAIKEGYILIKEGNVYSKVFIYEIKPLILLDHSSSQKESIILSYKEFLRQVNFDFQVYMMNRKYDFKEYTKNMSSHSNYMDPFYQNYLFDMEEKIRKELIYETFFYMVVSIKENQNLTIENIHNTVLVLERTGCQIKRVEEQEELYRILNHSIHKEDFKC